MGGVKNKQTNKKTCTRGRKATKCFTRLMHRGRCVRGGPGAARMVQLTYRTIFSRSYFAFRATRLHTNTHIPYPFTTRRVCLAEGWLPQIVIHTFRAATHMQSRAGTGYDALGPAATLWGSIMRVSIALFVSFDRQSAGAG